MEEVDPKPHAPTQAEKKKVSVEFVDESRNDEQQQRSKTLNQPFGLDRLKLDESFNSEKDLKFEEIKEDSAQLNISAQQDDVGNENIFNRDLSGQEEEDDKSEGSAK